jgi:hypothetical protein
LVVDVVGAVDELGLDVVVVVLDEDEDEDVGT